MSMSNDFDATDTTSDENPWDPADADELVTNLREILETLPDLSEIEDEPDEEPIQIGGFIMGQNDTSFIIYYGDMLKKGERPDNYLTFPLNELPSLLEAVNAHIWNNTEEEEENHDPEKDPATTAEVE